MKASIVSLGAVAALSLTFVVVTRPDQHADGDGPLASLDRPGYEKMAVDPAGSPTGTWTYGLRLCLSSGGDPAVIESVAPSTTAGTGFRFLGTKVREFLATDQHTSIISVPQFPPPPDVVPDALADVGGYAVATLCTDALQTPYTELLIGLGLQNHDGGGWRGIEVTYSVAGRRHVLVLNHDLLICGSAVAGDCAVPGKSAAP